MGADFEENMRWKTSPCFSCLCRAIQMSTELCKRLVELDRRHQILHPVLLIEPILLELARNGRKEKHFVRGLRTRSTVRSTTQKTLEIGPVTVRHRLHVMRMIRRIYS